VTDGRGGKWLSLVVECSILVELVVHGGIAHFLVVHGGKCNYPPQKKKERRKARKAIDGYGCFPLSKGKRN
jgi:hypothetical protein